MTTYTDSIYNKIGAETGLKQFVGALYNAMDELDAVKPVRDMHSTDLSYARDRLFMFLSGMLGGPPLYMEAFGHPRLRQKHMSFSIGDNERDQWLLCAENAVKTLSIGLAAKQELMMELSRMANHLRNRHSAIDVNVVKEDVLAFR